MALYLTFHRCFQVCLVMIVINMAVRCDITSVVYAIWLGAFLVLGRQNSSIVWPVYVGFLAVLLPLQYLLVLGWPPALCLGEDTFFRGGGRGGEVGEGMSQW